MEVKGVVFNIQKFSIHDGPGVRTTVFLKGCPRDVPSAASGAPTRSPSFQEYRSCTTAIIVCTVRGVCTPVPRKQSLLKKMEEYISTLIDVQVALPACRAAPDAR